MMTTNEDHMLTLTKAIYRFIFYTSVLLLAVGIVTFVLTMYVIEAARITGGTQKVINIIVIATPFAPIGTLFGTLKDTQSSRKKISIITFTLLSVGFLFLFIWGIILGAAFD